MKIFNENLIPQQICHPHNVACSSYLNNRNKRVTIWVIVTILGVTFRREKVLKFLNIQYWEI